MYFCKKRAWKNSPILSTNCLNYTENYKQVLNNALVIKNFLSLNRQILHTCVRSHDDDDDDDVQCHNQESLTQRNQSSPSYNIFSVILVISELKWWRLTKKRKRKSGNRLYDPCLQLWHWEQKKTGRANWIKKPVHIYLRFCVPRASSDTQAYCRHCTTNA